MKLADIQAMEQKTAIATKKDETKDYTGALLNNILAMAKPKADATTLIFVASDGYTIELALADVTACTDRLISFGDDNTLISAMPGMEGKAWAKALVEINFK